MTPDRVIEYLASGCQTFSPGDVAAGRYRIVRFIAEGGMGEVYEAEDAELGGSVALKTIRPDLVIRSGVIETFKQEIQLARRVTHPNVCRVYDIFWHRTGQEPGIAFLTMELLTDESLASRIRSRGALPHEEAQLIARGIARGIDAAHQAGVVHGDLKSGNVLLIPDSVDRERAVITDFGLAYERTSMAGPIRAGGTPAYISPEQLNGELTFASDVYSFGVVLFEMFTGTLPFRASTPEQTARLRLTGPLPRPRKLNPSIPRGWETAILACLQLDPKRRPTSASHALELVDRERLTRRWIAATGVAAGLGGGGILWFSSRKRLETDPQTSMHLKRASLFLGRRTQNDIQNAIAEYRAAVRLQPRNVSAWLGLSEACSVSANFHFSDVRTSLDEAINAARKAVELDENSGRAYGLLAYCTSLDVRRWRSSEPLFQRAIALDPRDAQIRLYYGAFLGKLGRDDESVANIQAGLAEDPTSLALNQQLAWEFYRARRAEDFFKQAQELVLLQPRDPTSHIAMARAFDWRKEYSDALRSIANIERYGDPLAAKCILASMEAGRGNRNLARALARELEAPWNRNEVESLMLADIYSRNGDADRAVEILEAGFERLDSTVLRAAHHPDFESLRGTPRFNAFLARIGLS